MTVLSNISKEKKCAVCSGAFTTRNSVQKYCSFECAKSARTTQAIAKTKLAEKRNKAKFKKEYGDRVGKLTLKCRTCKQPYDIYQSQVRHRGSTYCSITCKAAGQIRDKTIGQLVKDLDSVYSLYIRWRYSNKTTVACISCGKPDVIANMQNGHFVSRGHYSTRWLDKNCHPQCYRCNVALHGNYAHYTKFMIDTYGVEVIDELIALAAVAPKFKKADIQEKITYYKEELAKLK